MAPYLSKWAGSSQGYVGFMQNNGDLVDFLNIQYYNQKTYSNYNQLFKENTLYLKSAVEELIDAGIPPEKLVIG